MSEKIKVGVIGVGALGRHHARLYGEVKDAKVIGVYDANAEQAEKVATEFGLKPFKNLDELIGQVDAFSVAVPTDLHFEVVKKLLEAEKHVLVEKPITVAVDHGKALIDLAASKRLVLQVGHVERFNPVIEFLNERLHAPRFIESHRLAPYPPPRPGLKPRGTEVGVVLDLMIHDIDLVLSLVKEPVVNIEAVGVPVLSPTEDIANARLVFKGGCIANLTASRVTAEPMRKIRVFEPNCYLSLDYGTKDGFVYTRKDGTITREAVPITDHNALEMELRHFVSCVKELQTHGEEPASRVSGRHGLKALEIAVEITRQIANAGDPGLKNE